MEFRTLGPLVALDDRGEAVSVDTPLRRRLLSVLLLSADRAVPWASLERAAWGDEPPATARRSVQSHLSRLRTLGPEIRRVGDGYRLCVPRDTVDAHRFRALCERMTTATPDELREALGWWRGEPWADLAETFRPVEQAQLEEYRKAVEERLVVLRLRAGDHAVAAVEAERLTAGAPSRERRWVLWAIALYGEQRRREAFDVLDRARRSLGEAGLVPGVLLEQVEAVIVQDRPASEAVAVLDDAGPGPATVRAGALGGPPRAGAAQPSAASSFVGRDVEVRLLRGLLRNEPLVSITGAGGVGKTRLAVEVMTRSAVEFSGNAWFCELAPVGNPGAVAHAVASTLGVVPNTGGSVADAVAAFLRRQPGILVLDNCEHVRDAVAELVEVLLADQADAVILATSREPLGIPAEHVLPLAPLDPASEDGTRLFVDRAQRVLGAWQPTEEELDDVRAICVAVDGIPLGVELAAARLRSMSTTEIRDHLRRSVAFLHSGTRRVARHRTLDATARWSHELLDDEERRVFRQLSVFAGGFTSAAAEDVVAHDEGPRRLVDRLDGLVAKALVDVPERRATTRYRMLEPIRQFAAARLLESGTADEVRHRHATHFARHASLRSEDLAGTVDVDNLRTALDWLIEHENVELAMQLVHGVGVPSVLHQHLEVGDWCARVIDLPGAPEHPLAAEVAGLAAHFSFFQGRFEEARQLVHVAEAMPSYRPDRLYPANTRAVLCWFCGDVDGALAALDGVAAASTTTSIFVHWSRVMFRPDDPRAGDALDALAEIARTTPEARTAYLAARSIRAMATGSLTEADAAADELQRLVDEGGTEYDRYQAITTRAAAAALASTVDVAVMADLAAAMRHMRDRGHASRRWLLLRSAANILWRHGERREAALLRAGVTLGPFNAPALPNLEDPRLLEAARDAEDEARSLDLDRLTERAITAVEGLAGPR